MNKKGSVDDLIYIIIIIVAVAMFILIGFKVISQFNTQIQGMSMFSDNAKNVVNNVTETFPTVVDNTFLFLTVGLCIVAIVLAFLVRIHPVFFIFYIIFVPVIIFITGAMSNIYRKAAATTSFSDVAGQMVFMSHIVQYLPIIIGVFGFLLAFIMYNTWRAES